MPFTYRIVKRHRGRDAQARALYITISSPEAPGYEQLKRVLYDKYGFAISHVTSGSIESVTVRMRPGFNEKPGIIKGQVK